MIAVCSTEDKAALVREKGAFAALKYDDNLVKEINKLTDGKGANVVFDATGGSVFENALKWYHKGLNNNLQSLKRKKFH